MFDTIDQSLLFGTPLPHFNETLQAPVLVQIEAVFQGPGQIPEPGFRLGVGWFQIEPRAQLFFGFGYRIRNDMDPYPSF